MKKKIFKIIATVLILIIVFFISLPTLLNKAGLHPKFDSKKYNFTNKRAVIISTSHSTLNKPGETTGKSTGVFASELTVPYYDLQILELKLISQVLKVGKFPLIPNRFFMLLKQTQTLGILKTQY